MNQREVWEDEGRGHDVGSTTRKELMKRVGLTGLAAAAAGSLAPGGRAQVRQSSVTRERGGSVGYYSYSVYTVPSFFTPFSKKTGTKVKVQNYAELPDMISKLRATRGRGFDVISITSNIISSMASEGIIQPLDTSRLKNWKNVFQTLRNGPFLRYKGKIYGIPAVWGPEGLIYRTDVVPKGVGNSYDILWDSKYKGKLSTIDYGYENILVAAIHLGMKSKLQKQPIVFSAADLAKIKAHLIEQKQLNAKLWTDIASCEALLASGDVVATIGRIAVYNDLIKQKVPVALVNPKEGATYWANGYCISSGSDNLDRAYAFIDYLLSPEYGVALAKKYGYGSPSAAAMKAIGRKFPTLQQSLYLGDPNLLHGNKAVVWNPPSDSGKWDALWNEVKAS